MTGQTGISTSAGSHGHKVAWLHDLLVVTFGQPSRGSALTGALPAAPFIPTRDHLLNSHLQVTVIDDSLSMRS